MNDRPLAGCGGFFGRVNVDGRPNDFVPFKLPDQFGVSFID